MNFQQIKNLKGFMPDHEGMALFKWAKNNHGKSAVPKWNFHKILINKEGKVEDTFASFTKPMSKKLIKSIENIL